MSAERSSSERKYVDVVVSSGEEGEGTIMGGYKYGLL